MENNQNNPQDNIHNAELYAATENERKSLIDWYKDNSHVDLHDDGINTLCKICPPEEYGENDECEALQNIMRVMFYRLTELEKQNAEYRELSSEALNFIEVFTVKGCDIKWLDKIRITALAINPKSR